MFDVQCYWELVEPPTDRTRPRNTDLIRISQVGTEYECADWLPASPTCCSSGSRRINRARSSSRAAAARVAMLYDRGGPGVARRPGVGRGTPIVPFPPAVRPLLVRSSSAWRGSCACRSVTAVILTSHASRMKSDLPSVGPAVIWSAFNAASISDVERAQHSTAVARACTLQCRLS